MSSEIHVLDPIRFITARRLDLIIKRRLFLHFLNDDDSQAELIYLEHIARRAGAQFQPMGTYLPAAHYLFRSMQARGFDHKHPIPINRDWELLGGAHRTACAHVLGLKAHYEKLDTSHLWPAWGREWFLANDMADELPWIENELQGLTVAPPRAVHA